MELWNRLREAESNQQRDDAIGRADLIDLYSQCWAVQGKSDEPRTWR